MKYILSIAVIFYLLVFSLMFSYAEETYRPTPEGKGTYAELNSENTFTKGIIVGGDNSRVTFNPNSEYIGNETDDLILFQGVSGSDDTDLTLDLDGTLPTFYSATDSAVGFSDDITVVAKNINLDITTTENIGVIEKGGQRYFHDFKAASANGQNLFIGLLSGNFSMSGTGSESSKNVGIGNSSLQNLTTGWGNIAIGAQAGQFATTSNQNTVIGSGAFAFNITGAQNTIIGHSSATAMSDLNNSVVIGADSSPAASGNTNETVIGYGVTGNGSNTATIGNTSVTQTFLRGVTNIRGANNNCNLTVDDDGTCDAGTSIGVDNGIALCLVCTAN